MRQESVRRRFSACLIGVAAVFVPALARADFTLVTPTPWIVEDPDSGNPQTVAPCGVDPSVCYTPSGAVTTYIAGTEITLFWTETVPVDGWYRVSLSYNNRTDLVDPVVLVDDAGLSADAANAGDPTIDAAVGINAVLPVLADGLFPYPDPAVGPHAPGWMYQYHVTLPDMPCDKCTLQITQFLNDHTDNLANGNPSGYFAHHCADIRIASDTDPLAVPGTVTIVDAGGPSPGCFLPPPDASVDAPSMQPEAGPDAPDAGEGADAAIEAAPPAADAADEDAAPMSVDDATISQGSDAAPPPASTGGGGGGCGCTAAGTTAPAMGGGGSLLLGLLLVARRRSAGLRARARSRWGG